MGFETIAWHGDALGGSLHLLDQTQLPAVTSTREIRDVDALIEAIRLLRVRGAPAIGVSAAYGCVLAARAQPTRPLQSLLEWLPALHAARPTAVNLGWALRRLEAAALRHVENGGPEAALPEQLLGEARAVHREDARLCDAIASNGAPLLRAARRVLTHCNTGALATAGIGTALGVIRRAHEQGAGFEVLAGETRPLLQGARLTAWELGQLGIPHAILPDGAGPGLLLRGEIDAVIVGFDRVAANGDLANKVGTLPLALAAREAGVPFYAAGPSSSFDLELASGAEIPIEERSGSELRLYLAADSWPQGSAGRSPAFDVTPASLVRALICEHGVLRAPETKSIKELLLAGR